MFNCTAKLVFIKYYKSKKTDTTYFLPSFSNYIIYIVIRWFQCYIDNIISNVKNVYINYKLIISSKIFKYLPFNLCEIRLE